MTQQQNTQNIINVLELDLNEIQATGNRGWSNKQEIEIVHNINHFAVAAKEQYEAGDYKNAYSNMRIYVTTKNKLYNHLIDEFDLEDVLYDIHQYFKEMN